MDDCLIIGAGVVGLSLAYEMAGHGLRVSVIDHGELGREASWAGGGILPAATLRPADSAYEQLSGLSHRLHSEWSEQLREETGMDNEYRVCGELYIASKADNRERLSEEVAAFRRRGIDVADVAGQLSEVEPALASDVCSDADTTAFRLPQSGQLRNPRHLKALIAACRRRGVRLCGGVRDLQFELNGEGVMRVSTNDGDFKSEQYCVCAGAWSHELLSQLGCHIPVKPVRGQMVLLNGEKPYLRNVVHEDLQYLVPRVDGRVLVGSTLEDVGFDKRTTTESVNALLDFALTRVPALRGAEVERCWAGLRPGSPAGQPFIGRVPRLNNAYCATGHFRWGLYLSPGTAVVMSQLIRGETPQIDLHEFRLDRP